MGFVALKDMKPTAFEDLVAVLALYCPGPMEQIPYTLLIVKRNWNVQYPHASLFWFEPTYGISVYSQQVMQAASKACRLYSRRSGYFTACHREEEWWWLLRKREACAKEHSVKRGYKQEDAETVYDYIESLPTMDLTNLTRCLCDVVLSVSVLKGNYPTAFFTALFQNASAKSAKLQDYLVEARQLGIKIRRQVSTAVLQRLCGRW